MNPKYLYSIILELSPTAAGVLPATTGHQAHALFLNLVKQIDPVLSARLHDEQDYRPFTVSPLGSPGARAGTLVLQTGQTYHIHVTLLDGGSLWQCLSAHFLEASTMTLSLGGADFALRRVLSTPAADATGWAGHTDWQTLAGATACQCITLRFASPTAFSLGDRRYALFPEPLLLWDSLMRVWNRYAPEILRIDKLALREFVTQHVTVSDYALHTTTLSFPRYIQKGFMGTCSYAIKPGEAYAAHVSALAEFARYAGVGYKTTMGMGQARVEAFNDGR